MGSKEFSGKLAGACPSIPFVEAVHAAEPDRALRRCDSLKPKGRGETIME